MKVKSEFYSHSFPHWFADRRKVESVKFEIARCWRRWKENPLYLYGKIHKNSYIIRKFWEKYL